MTNWCCQSLWARNPPKALPTPYFDWRYTGRLDHHINDKNTIFLTYSNQNNNGDNDQATNQSDLTAGNTTTNQIILGNITWNSVINDHIVNSLMMGYQYWNNKILATTLSPYFTYPDGTNLGTNVNVPQQSYPEEVAVQGRPLLDQGQPRPEDGHRLPVRALAGWLL